MDFQIFRLRLIRFIPVVVGFWTVGCGYGFQNTKNPLSEREQINKIYIAPITNNTYKAGVESVIYNNLIRVISAHRRIILVKDPEEADAILQGTVGNASYVGISGTQVFALSPSQLVPSLGRNLPSSNFIISSIYSATLGCSFSLVRKNPDPKKKTLIWTSTFSRDKPFPSANQLDVPGTTSSLINESEFERSLNDLARNMMDDVHESMLAMF